MNTRNSLILGSLIIIGFILLGFIQGTFQEEANVRELNERYEMVQANDNNIIIFDQQTGQYWRKFIPDSEGPTEWTKENSPIKK